MSQSNSSSRLHGSLQACLLIVAVLATGAASAACSGDHTSAPTQAAKATQPAVAGMGGMTAVQAAAWAGRPAYTHNTARTEEAYQYAMEHPLVMQWIPCYCGCGAMGHRSNLDCYYEPTTNGSVVFDEHASYCGVCVDITLRTKQLAESGTSLAGIRAAIDAEFGGIGPGTDTARPAS